MKRYLAFRVVGVVLGLLLSLPIMGQAEEVPARIVLEKDVHFNAPDGTDVHVQAGEYDISGAESTLQLFPIGQDEPIIIQATATTHDEDVDLPIVLGVPEEGAEADLYHLVMFQSGGKSLDAVGSLSGIKSRGLKDRLAQRPLINKIIQAGQATITKPEEPRVEMSSPQVSPAVIPVGSEINFKDASGWIRKVCQWVGGPAISYHQWGCQSNIDLANGLIQVKADFFTGPRLRWTRAAEAWVEMYKDFTIPPPSGSGQAQTKMATFNVPIEYHGKALSTYPMIAQGHYKILLALDEVSYDAGPGYKTLHLESRVLAEDTVKAGVKVMKGIPLPVPDGALATEKNPVYFSAPIIPGRIYRLTLRVEVDATHVPVNLAPSSYGMGSAVNFMDKSMIISERQRVNGYIKWGTVTVRINP
ncbi:MAG: hypothetical protein OEY28_13310 [Nitrospira sp.]|nr:hypothetical protein [Nitrospira sp.]